MKNPNDPIWNRTRDLPFRVAVLSEYAYTIDILNEYDKVWIILKWILRKKVGEFGLR
jgi:hypothetical protein